MLIYLAVEPPKFNKYFDLFKALRIVKSSKENKFFFLNIIIVTLFTQRKM